MISVHIVFLLLILHFFSDFVLQTDYIERSGINSNWNVTKHTLLYSIPFLWFGVFWFGFLYVAVNILLHLFVDYITSNLSNFYVKRNDKSSYFAVLGLDQLIHTLVLIGTYYFMFIRWGIIMFNFITDRVEAAKKAIDTYKNELSKLHNLRKMQDKYTLYQKQDLNKVEEVAKFISRSYRPNKSL